jgi:beta-lactamase superfamily II metal-dependent hydrolase
MKKTILALLVMAMFTLTAFSVGGLDAGEITDDGDGTKEFRDSRPLGERTILDRSDDGPTVKGQPNPVAGTMVLSSDGNTLHILVDTDGVNYNAIKTATYSCVKGGSEANGDLVNNLDTTYTADVNLEAGTWTVSVMVKDAPKNYFDDEQNHDISGVDNPPGCTVADPSEDAILCGVHRIEVSATDGTGLNKVEVSIDSGTYVDITQNWDGTHYYYDWTTTGVQDGSHTIDARATDTASQTTGATQVTATVDNTFSDELRIYTINVGQGDSALIISPTGTTMLVDAGNNGKGTSAVLPLLSQLGVTSLDYVVASHYHADHIGGIDEVLNAGISVTGAALDRGGTYSSLTYTDYVTAVGGKRTTITDGQTIDLGGGASVKCVAVNGNGVSGASNENDLSVVLVVSLGYFEYYTGGDLSGVDSSSYKDIETSVAAEVGNIEVCKVDHHGSSYSTNQNFVDALKPDVSIFPVGTNSYGHPAQVVIDRLVGADSYLYLTEAGSGGTVPDGKGTVVNGNILTRSSGSGNFAVNGDPYVLYSDDTPPQVSITSPDDGATVSNGVTVTVSAQDAGSGVDEVEISIDGGEWIPGPTYEWDTTAVDNGAYTIDARAKDMAGNTGNAQQISVTVNNVPTVNKWALVIGISDYEGSENDLEYCDDDADDWEAVLQSNGYTVTKLLDTAATKDAIVAAVAALLSSEDSDDHVVVTYSGHGSKQPQYGSCIVTTDLWYITQGWFDQEFGYADSSHIYFNFDACRIGGMEVLADTETGRLVCMASTDKTNSYDGDAVMQNGVYTYYIMEGLTLYSSLEDVAVYAEQKCEVWVSQFKTIKFEPNHVDTYSGDMWF